MMRWVFTFGVAAAANGLTALVVPHAPLIGGAISGGLSIAAFALATILERGKSLTLNIDCNCED